MPNQYQLEEFSEADLLGELCTSHAGYNPGREEIALGEVVRGRNFFSLLLN